MNRTAFTVILAALCLVFTAHIQAFPTLDLSPDTPDISSNFIDVSYVGNNTSGTLIASGFSTVLTPPGTPTGSIAGGSFDIIASISFNAQTATGTLTIGGTIAALGFNSGTLLTGTLSSTAGDQTFGAGSEDPLEFIFTVTGGDAASLYGPTAGVILSNSGFSGTFSSDFSGAPFGALADTFILSIPLPVVAHPENHNIVGLVDGNSVCFNNDGVISSILECDVSSVDEGYVFVSSGWRGGSISGINGCGASAVAPVSDATCPLSMSPSVFATCTNNEYVLVQTTKSGHFWTIRANGDCSEIATPETTGLVPCLSTDAFNQVNGCYDPTPPEISVKDGFIRTDSDTLPPLDVHCNDVAEFGRMFVDGVNDIIYVCTPGGWSEH